MYTVGFVGPKAVQWHEDLKDSRDGIYITALHNLWSDSTAKVMYHTSQVDAARSMLGGDLCICIWRRLEVDHS